MPDERLAALAELDRTRRRHRLADVDWFDSFYHAYLTALGVGVATVFASTFVPDQVVGTATAEQVADQGPAVIGIIVAVALALGLRSGGRGGPLALEAPTVVHVLLAPVDRTAALRGPAMRQLRFAAYAGAVAGSVAGLLAQRRLPVDPYASVLCGALTMAAIAVAAVGVALFASGHRMRPRSANLLGVLIVAGAAADLAAGTTLSPTGLVGRLALWPLDFDPLALLGVALGLGLGVLGWFAVGGTSLEAARLRAGLVSELRFAVTLQDLRTVVLLRRRLAQEKPRSRPWFRLPHSRHRQLAVVRRGLQSVLRFPVARLGRLVILGVVAGLALAGAWSGTSVLVVVAGLALYVAALDAVEPLAQEIDHVDRWASYPVVSGGLLLRHIPAGVVVVAGVCALATLTVAAAATTSAVSAEVVGVVATLILPVSITATAAAAASTAQGLSQFKANLNAVPEFAGTALVARNGWPPALVMISLVPLLAARGAVTEGLAAAPVAASTASLPLVLSAAALFWLSRREPVRF